MRIRFDNPDRARKGAAFLEIKVEQSTPEFFTIDEISFDLERSDLIVAIDDIPQTITGRPIG